MNFIDRALEQKLTGDDFLQAMVKRIALHNDYESFWNAVRNYIDKSL